MRDNLFNFQLRALTGNKSGHVRRGIFKICGLCRMCRGSLTAFALLRTKECLRKANKRQLFPKTVTNFAKRTNNKAEVETPGFSIKGYPTIMYKLKTKLHHFRFNTVQQQGPFSVTLYKLIDDEDSTCFTHEELTQLTNYISANKINFGLQNYEGCYPDDAPAISLYDSIPGNIAFPKYLIIRKTPQLPKGGGEIYRVMDIELLNENGSSNHHYNLDFTLIVEIESL